MAEASSTNIRLSKPSSPSRESSETWERGRAETCATRPKSQSASWCCSRGAVFSVMPARFDSSSDWIILTTSRRFTLRVAVRGSSSSVK
jgi:hypothetical protein